MTFILKLVDIERSYLKYDLSMPTLFNVLAKGNAVYVTQQLKMKKTVCYEMCFTYSIKKVLMQSLLLSKELLVNVLRDEVKFIFVFIRS